MVSKVMLSCEVGRAVVLAINVDDVKMAAFELCGTGKVESTTSNDDKVELAKVRSTTVVMGLSPELMNVGSTTVVMGLSPELMKLDLSGTVDATVDTTIGVSSIVSITINTLTLDCAKAQPQRANKTNDSSVNMYEVIHIYIRLQSIPLLLYNISD